MNPAFARKDDPDKGRHLVAKRGIAKDELIFVERPLISLQSIGNAHQGALCCRCCRCFVGGPDLAISVASGKVNREDIWDFYKELHKEEEETTVAGKDGDEDEDHNKNHQNNNYRMVPCRNDCGEIFCSQECEKEMWTCGGHDLLCTGLIPEPEPESKTSDNATGNGSDEKDADVDVDADSHDQLHPLLQFKVYAVQSNEIFIMVADLVAAVVSIRRQQIALNRREADCDAGHSNRDSVGNDNCSEVTLKELLAPYLDFTLVPWWEVATADLISDPMKMVECIELNRVLKDLCATASKLLHDAFLVIEGDDEFQETLRMAMKECQDEYGLFTQDFFGKIIGSYEQNAMGLRARHPLCRDILEDSELRGRRHEELVKCIELAGMIGDGEDGCEDEQELDEDEDEQKSASYHIDGKGDIASSEFQEKAFNLSGPEKQLDGTIEDSDYMYSVDDIAEFMSGLHIDEEGLSTNTKVDGDHGEEEGTGDDLDTVFTPLDGTCMYYTACKMNHSCEPNVVARYSYSCSSGGQLARWGKDFPLVVQCVALRDMKAGEELCISYIKSDAPLEERQKELSNYGFCCECEKCIREKSGTDGETQEWNDDPFGDEDEDEDDLFGEEEDTEGDGVGETLLVERVNTLNKSLAGSTAGNVPISILAPAISFINQLCSQLLQELDSSRNDDALVLEITKTSLEMLRDRDFSGLNKIASKGEMLTLSLLRRSGSWPSSSLREAHGCFCVATSICHAQNGNFFPAIRFLDKASIFGLPRERIDSFFNYVECHVSRVSCSHTASCAAPNVLIPDYCSLDLQQDILNKGLKNPILNPINEIDANMSSDYSLGSEQIVIRNYATDWPARQKWR